MILGEKKKIADEMRGDAKRNAEPLRRQANNPKNDGEKFIANSVGFAKFRKELIRIAVSDKNTMPEPISDTVLNLAQQTITDARTFAFGKEMLEKGSGEVYFIAAEDFESDIASCITYSHVCDQQPTPYRIGAPER